MAVLKYLQSHPEAKQEDIAKHIGKSISTIKRMTPTLIERGLLQRKNGKRNRKWLVKI
jgi:DNA-binding MarR family transcriptional regulator